MKPYGRITSFLNYTFISIALGFIISALSAHAEDITGKELVLKGEVTGTGRLDEITYTNHVIAGGDHQENSLKIIDVSDVTSPTLAWSHTMTGRFYGVSENGVNIYSCSFASPPGEGWLDIMDVTDPYSPTIQTHFETRNLALGVDVEGSTVVVADDDSGLTVINASDISNPAIIGSYSQVNAQTIKINGTLVALREATSGNHRLHLYDISNTESITQLSVIDLPNSLSEIAFTGSYMYVAHYLGVDVFDISDPTSPVKVGAILNIGKTTGIDIAGTKIYVVYDDLLRIYDITDPANPLYQLERQVDGEALSVKVFDSYVAVGTDDSLQIYELQDAKEKELVLKKTITDTQQMHYLDYTGDVLVAGSYYNDKFMFFDISDPLNPEIAYTYPLADHCSRIYANGSYVYGGHYNSSPRQGWLEIFDVTDPYAPDLVSHFSARDVVAGIGNLSEDVLLLADDDEGLSILDVSDLNNPVTIDTQYQVNATNVGISGDYAAIGDASIGSNHIYFYNISSKTDIIPVGSVAIPGKMHDMDFEGSVVYAAEADTGVVIVDASDPSNPIHISTISDIGEAWSVDVVGSTLYVASGENLFIYDVTDPAAPVKLYECPTDGIAKGIVAKDSVIYVGTENSLQVFTLQNIPKKELAVKKTITDTQQMHYLDYTGDVLVAGSYYNDKFMFFDISDPLNPEIAYTYPLADHCSRIYANGSYVYGGHYNSSPRQGWLEIFDVTDPYAPDLVSHFSARDVVAGIGNLSEDVLLLADDDEGLSILDVSDLNNPVTIDTQYQVNATNVGISGDYAAIGDASIGSNHIYFYNISSKTDIIPVGSVAIPGKMHDMDFEGSVVYAAEADTGVVIVDASDPSNPIHISTISDIGEAWSVDVVGSTLYVASGENLFIYDVTDPAAPVKLYECPTDGIAKGIVAKDSVIYVGTENSLQVFTLQNVADVVWVDFAYTGEEWGSEDHPYNTLAEGVIAVKSGGTIRIKTGATDAGIRITNPMRIEANGGPVVIGRGSISTNNLANPDDLNDGSKDSEKLSGDLSDLLHQKNAVIEWHRYE